MYVDHVFLTHPMLNVSLGPPADTQLRLGPRDGTHDLEGARIGLQYGVANSGRAQVTSALPGH